MKNSRKKLIGLFVVIAIILAGVVFFTKPAGNENLKSVTIEIISERDEVNEKTKYETELEFLGELLIEEDLVEYSNSEYGMFITGVDGMLSDDTQQYWWSISVDGKMAEMAADQTVLTEGSTYTLELQQGY